MARNEVRHLGWATAILSSPYRLLLPTIVVLLAAIYLHLGGVHTDTKQDTKLNINNKFNYNNGKHPNAEDYRRLIQELRNRLASGNEVHGFPVTRPVATIPLQEHFIQVELENDEGDVITVIINTVDVYVVAYLVGAALRPTLYYLRFNDQERTRGPLFEAFPEPQYTRIQLTFGGNYPDLPPREEHELGHGALNDAIRKLFYEYSQDSAMLVIIQMLSEAVRIRYMEYLIRVSMENNRNFIPEPRARSIENEWASLSRRIQRSGESGVINPPVQINNASYHIIEIRNVEGVRRQAALALMLYQCNPRNAIRMPVPVDVGADDQCPSVEPTTNIVGMDGKCMDVSNNDYTNGNSIILYKCGNAKSNQLWTFKSDGTIRSNGKCLTTSDYSIYSYIVINDCHTAKPEATQWKLYNGGTIMNPISCLVIETLMSTDGTRLNLDFELNVSRQAWSFQNNTQPTINYISGLSEMCLQANGPYSPVSLANCVIGTEPRQQWAFYGDNTIRPYNDSTRCVKPKGYRILDSIILSPCDGWTVRWTFMADGTILHPYSGLVMDVKKSDVSLQEIILYQPTGNPNQKWLAF